MGTRTANKPSVEINLISWTFSPPTIIIAIDRRRYRYHVTSTTVVDRVIWLFNHNWLGRALIWAKGHATRTEKL